MKITFRQSGGLAGLAKVAELDTDQMGVDEAETLKALVMSSDFFYIPVSELPPQPDQEQYFIAVETVDHRRELQLNPSTIPPGLAPLIQHLARQAQYEKRRRR